MLSDLIIKITKESLRLQNKEDNSFPGGHNGPYYDPETPVRNSSHWLITLAKCYELSNDELFKEKVHELAEYLYSRTARPNGFSFYHRYKTSKDRCNGLIGQAWTFEALVEAARILGDDKYELLAEKVFFQHSFDSEYGLWYRLEIDGRILPLDGTFNHQLWFVACSSLIKGEKREQILHCVNQFMDCLSKNLIVLKNGLIFHKIKWAWEKSADMNFSPNDNLQKRIRTFLGSSIQKIQKLTIYKDEIYRSVGYHSFNMYAFALLKGQIPHHSFWNSKLLRKLTDYMLTEAYKRGLAENKYGYPYNPPGFEVPYSLSLLTDMYKEDLLKHSQWWLTKQFEMCYNAETGMMDRTTEDSLTHTARIYEVTRLPSQILKQINIPEEAIG